MADPKPVVTLTLMPPIMLHTKMYHNIVLVPYLPDRDVRFGSAQESQETDLGATKKMMTKDAAIRMEP